MVEARTTLHLGHTLNVQNDNTGNQLKTTNNNKRIHGWTHLVMGE
jgi:hypothetical protein